MDRRSAPWPAGRTYRGVAERHARSWKNTEGVTVATSGGLSPDWTNRRYDPKDLWAYHPLWKDEDGRLTKHGQNPIDVLIDDRLSELGLQAAPPADRTTLIRRATFDLIGLPPTPDEVDAFTNDPAPDEEAFSKVVERLLASPHYGEQWGQHWLDVVRYADSSGFANDYERGNAWRYRDYVVRSFNSDKPYDQFVREQIAGDEMVELRVASPESRVQNGNPKDATANPNSQPSTLDPQSSSELLIAAGFLRMGPWELTGMEVPKVARQRFLDDVTDAVGQVFLGHMLQCCRCHDHKFDPVPTQDYYSFQANFATTQLAERDAEFLPEENTAFHDEQRFLKRRQNFYDEILSQVESKRTLDAARRWLADEQRDDTPFEEAVAELRKNRGGVPPTLDEVRRQLQQQHVDPALIPPRHVGFEPRDFGLERIARKGQSRLAWQFDRYQPYAHSVYNGRTPDMNNVAAPLRIPGGIATSEDFEPTYILTGGDPFSPSQQVEPGVLSVVELENVRRDSNPVEASTTKQTGSESRRTESISGRRLKLAGWIASKDNPLTARVMANRVWQWHFGRAIAGNPNNFGATGKKPTHPELLDWLAGRFVDGGWSVKNLHRIIMSSRAYRRASSHPDPEALSAKDPDGTSYAAFQPRRLTAEELRDSMLAVSGELNREVGGIPIRPEMNLEAALQPRMVMGTFAEAWQPSPLPQQRHRRSIYALKLRGLRDPFQEVFNAPSPDLSCEARDASMVTPQVFAMFNSDIAFSRALAFAKRVSDESPSDEAAIVRVFRLAVNRRPTDEELQACLRHWREMTDRHHGIRFDPPSFSTEVVREAVEENTGEKFTFTEPLEVIEEFVPDLHPSDADPKLRGLAEVCLVVMNSAEFTYLY
ncbi:MAG: DUF1549 and DUF1553 domain-containing protein [Planctomycetaceae bacterium]